MPSAFVVTGVKGFIGRRLAEALSARGDSVFGLDIADFEDVESLKSEIAELFRAQELNGVFHVGALADTLAQDPNIMLAWNADFTFFLSELSALSGVPLIYSSSAANYGTDGRVPSNLYGWSKYLGEKFCSANKQVSLRYFNVFGPGESHKGPMASFLFQAWNKNQSGDEVRLFPGLPKRDFIHVDDVVAANLIAMSHYSTVSRRVFDVGGGEATSFEDLLDWAELPFLYADESSIPKGYQFFTRANRSRFLPGWAPAEPLELRVKSYIDYLQELV